MSSMGIGFLSTPPPQAPKREPADPLPVAPPAYVSTTDAARLLGGTPSESTIRRELVAAPRSPAGRVTEGPWRGSVLRHRRWKVARACIERLLADAARSGEPLARRETAEQRLARRLEVVEAALARIEERLYLGGAMLLGEDGGAR